MSHRLEVDSVILEFNNKRVLSDIYLKSETGKVTGILGRNGSGKTSLMNIIFGELNPINKSVRIDNKTLLGSRRNQKDINYLPQYNIVPDNYTFTKVINDFDLNIHQFIELFPEFEKLSSVKFRELSGGMKRILEIYVILKSKAKFSMLDEPFSHIMPKHVKTIKGLIVEVSKTKGVIITDHLYNDILEISNEIYLLNNGKISKIEDYHDLQKKGYINT
ncbi:ATP-binding cassette domain-containing protein [Flagellimonas beolgyonensis]|uniref:ATP-binding cassette domain-containing protein n=1 Tax=Flagellimonas beolgyonensis TaxID=864064 RepID=UPI000F8ED1F6|nr:ATP-binding cassette domain-containing protein [Allomuricauda beolgyonensis]